MRAYRRFTWFGTAVATVVILAGGAREAAASHNAFEQISVGATGGNGTLPTQFSGASADGTRVFLRTEEKLAASDTDETFDIYENSAGTVIQVSIGPSGGNSDLYPDPFFRGSSTDGSRVFFETYEPLVTGDVDDCEPLNPEPTGCLDVYQRSGGVTTLMSTGTAATNDHHAEFEGTSQDGTIVFFRTRESLVASDSDTEFDVYEHSGGTTKLVSTGTTGGTGAFPSFFRGSSADGARAFFSTVERLMPADVDSSADVYQRAAGSTALLSTGPAGGNGAVEARYAGTTLSGGQVFLETEERLTSSDTDNSIDVYERAGATTTLVSTGPTGGNGAHDARFKKASEGGSRLFFQTRERLTSSDTDNSIDVYERAGGTTTLTSIGPAGGNGAFDGLFQDISSDGGTVLVGTMERLTSGDADNRFDIYERKGGTTTLLTTGPPGGNGDYDAFFDGMSRDGRRVFFETLEQLSGDTDLHPDVYERAGGVTTKVSRGSIGGNGAVIATFVGTSDDGARAFFNTHESLSSADTDTNADVYVARISNGYARPMGATPARLALVLAYRPCTSPNRAHGPPALGGGAFDASCNPPIPASDYLTVGTADSNARPANSAGLVTYSAKVGNPSTQADEADVRLEVTITDVRRKTDLQDYTGQLQVDATVRLTDKYSGSSPVDPATVSELSFPFVVPCAATGDTGIGATCSIDTTADAVVPGSIREGARAIWQLGQVEVRDGGADGQAATSPNTVFARQGLFVP